MKIFKPQTEGIKEGIYFDLPNEVYQKDYALSRSGMSKIFLSWADYWESSPYNPNFQFSSSKSMQSGTKKHEYLLERTEFFKRYNVAGRFVDYKKGNIGSVEFKEIKESIESIISVPGLKEHFEVGFPEVSIFVRCPLSGVMLRARCDYLYTFGVLDYKTIKAVNNPTIGKAVSDHALDIQSALTIYVINIIRKRLKKGDVAISGCPNQEWLDAFIKDKDLMFRFLFQRSTPPYIWEFRELEPDVLQDGNDAMHFAIKLFVENMNKHGTGKPPCGEKKVKTISSYYVRRRQYDY